MLIKHVPNRRTETHGVLFGRDIPVVANFPAMRNEGESIGTVYPIRLNFGSRRLARSVHAMKPA